MDSDWSLRRARSDSGWSSAIPFQLRSSSVSSWRHSSSAELKPSEATSWSRFDDKLSPERLAKEQKRPSGVEMRLLSLKSRCRSSLMPARDWSVSVRAMAGQSVLWVRMESRLSSGREANEPGWMARTLHDDTLNCLSRGSRLRMSRSRADSKKRTSLHSIRSEVARSGCDTLCSWASHSAGCRVRSWQRRDDSSDSSAGWCCHWQLGTLAEDEAAVAADNNTNNNNTWFDGIFISRGFLLDGDRTLELNKKKLRNRTTCSIRFTNPTQSQNVMLGTSHLENVQVTNVKVLGFV